MGALGTPDLNQFLQKLDELTLLDLCTDILSMNGHKNIRITEGPGDGQRDIHSVDNNGNNYLTQAKYHNDLSHTIPSKELGEVVMGMVRLGYKHGLFITTSTRISPQAKRDCLNDYPGYFIDFWDGKEIVNKIFENLVLKAIWYDGYSFDKVAFKLVFPIIVRDLSTDKPIQILSKSLQTFKGNNVSAGRSQVQITYQRNRVNNLVFGSYRPPNRKTYGEVGSTTISSTEAILSGIIHLDDIDFIFTELKNDVLFQTKSINTRLEHFAIIFGIPSLTPLAGESSGVRIELVDYKPKTIVCHDDFIENEIDWVCPSKKSLDWVLPRRPSCSQANWIRWHNLKNDLCLDIYVISKPSEEDRWQFVEQRNYFIRWWKESLFMMVPKEILTKLDKYEVDEPTKRVKWDDSFLLCGWLHPIYNSPFMRLPIEPEYENVSPQFSENERLEIFRYFEDVKNKLLSIGSSVVEPAIARHMFAIRENDPYPEIENVLHQGKNIGYFPDMIPTPIEPDSRTFQYTVCWKIILRKKFSQKIQNELSELIDNLQSLDFHNAIVNFFLDVDTRNEEPFIICEIEKKPSNIFQNTEKVLLVMTPEILDFIDEIEEFISERIKFTRATREYWDKELLLLFNP